MAELGRGSPRWPNDHPAPAWGPRLRGTLNTGGWGFPPEWGSRMGKPAPTRAPPHPPLASYPHPQDPPSPKGLAALLTWLVFDLEGVATVLRKERLRWQSASLCPAPCPTAPLLVLLGSSLPGAKSRTLRPSPWCQLPASVFLRHRVQAATPAPELMGQFCKDPESAPGVPRASPRPRHWKRSSGLPPPTWQELCRCPSEFIC